MTWPAVTSEYAWLLRRQTTPLLLASAISDLPSVVVWSSQVAAVGPLGPGMSGHWAFEVHSAPEIVHFPNDGQSAAEVQAVFETLHCPALPAHFVAALASVQACVLAG